MNLGRSECEREPLIMNYIRQTKDPERGLEAKSHVKASETNHNYFQDISESITIVLKAISGTAGPWFDADNCCYRY